MFGIKYDYSVLIHYRHTEDDPYFGTVIYSTNGLDGPWHPMVTGDTDHCFEIVEVLYKAQEPKESEKF
jgi:hypothetical protein